MHRPTSGPMRSDRRIGRASPVLETFLHTFWWTNCNLRLHIFSLKCYRWLQFEAGLTCNPPWRTPLPAIAAGRRRNRIRWLTW